MSILEKKDQASRDGTLTRSCRQDKTERERETVCVCATLDETRTKRAKYANNRLTIQMSDAYYYCEMCTCLLVVLFFHRHSAVSLRARLCAGASHGQKSRYVYVSVKRCTRAHFLARCFLQGQNMYVWTDSCIVLHRVLWHVRADVGHRMLLLVQLLLTPRPQGCVSTVCVAVLYCRHRWR